MRFFLMLFVCVVSATHTLAQSVTKLEVFNIAWDDMLNVRSGPSAKFPIVASVPLGYDDLSKYECVLLKKSSFAEGKLPLPEWCAVSKVQAFIGWVNASYLKAMPTLQDRLVFMDGHRS